MFQKVKERGLVNAGMGVLGLMLIFLADISTSTATLIFWHEPDCPTELLK